MMLQPNKDSTQKPKNFSNFFKTLKQTVSRSFVRLQNRVLDEDSYTGSGEDVSANDDAIIIQDSSSSSSDSSNSNEFKTDLPFSFDQNGSLYFSTSGLIISPRDIDSDLYDFFLNKHPECFVNEKHISFLNCLIPKMTKINDEWNAYIVLHYLDFGYFLVDGCLPTESQMNASHYDNFEAPFDGVWFNGVSESVSSDDIQLDENPLNVLSPSKEFHCKSLYDKSITIISDDPSMSDYLPKQKIDNNYPPINRSGDYTPLSTAQYIDRFRSGPKNRGPLRCNKNNIPKTSPLRRKESSNFDGYKNSKRRKMTDKTQTQMKTESIAYKKKKNEVEKEGKVWKESNKMNTRANKNAKLLDVALKMKADMDIADKIAAVETAELNYEEIMYPDPEGEFYVNYSSERDHMLSLLKDAQRKHKESMYQLNECSLNSMLSTTFANWSSTDMFSVARSSVFEDELSRIENFIIENKSSEDVKIVTDALINEVNVQPKLIDKCSTFLKNLILKLKPMAFSGDTVHDVILGIDYLKDDYAMQLLEEVPVVSMTKDGKVIDVRDDHARRGDLVHQNPLLYRFNLNRIQRGMFPISTDYSGIVSLELLFQLMSPSVCVMNASEELVLSKMQHVAANIHTINLPKFSIFEYGTDIVQDTLLAARALFLTRRRVVRALGFPISPQ